MDERDVEQLMMRYRPADPPPSLDERISHLVEALPRQPRVWPWAAAAAALLAITAGLHALTNSGDIPRVPVSDALVQQLGGDAAAAAAAHLIDATEGRESTRTPAADFWSEVR